MLGIVIVLILNHTSNSFIWLLGVIWAYGWFTEGHQPIIKWVLKDIFVVVLGGREKQAYIKPWSMNIYIYLIFSFCLSTFAAWNLSWNILKVIMKILEVFKIRRSQSDTPGLKDKIKGLTFPRGLKKGREGEGGGGRKERVGRMERGKWKGVRKERENGERERGIRGRGKRMEREK